MKNCITIKYIILYINIMSTPDVDSKIQNISELSLEIVNSCLSAIIFSSFLLHKLNLSKQDILIAQKYFVEFLFFSIILCIKVINIENNEKKSVNETHEHILFTFLIVFYVLTFYIAYENYLNLKDPSHIFRNLIQKTKSYLNVDLFCFILSEIVIIFSVLIHNEGSNDSQIGNDGKYLKLLYNVPFCICLTLISLFMFFIYYLNKHIFPKYELNSKFVLIKTNKLYLAINWTLLAFSLFLFALIYVKSTTNSEYDLIISFSIRIGIYLLNLFDNILFIMIIYYSSFYYYVLGNSCLGGCLAKFGCTRYFNKIRKENSILFQPENLTYKTTDTSFFMNHLLNNIGYAIDDYIIETFEYVLNISLLSITMIFGEDITINEEKLLVNMNVNLSVADENNIKQRIYERKDFEARITNNNALSKINFHFDKVGELKVIIESHYSNQIDQQLKEFKISKESIIQSLQSHKFISLLSKNVKEDRFFKSLKTFCLKTYDHKLVIDIYNKNILDNNTDIFFQEYFQYIREKKRETFLPIIVGIYKIKINKFHEFTLIISLNSLNDNNVRHYNIWQLMRLNAESDREMEYISSSKDKDFFQITTDLLFEENQHFKINDDVSFKRIFSEDVKFLKKVHSNKFSLMMLYFELSESVDKKKDKVKEYFDDILGKVDNVPGPILNDTLLDNDLESKFQVNYQEFDELANNEGMSIAFSEYGDCVNKNKYDCSYGKFNGVVYFAFCNLFDLGGFCSNTSNFYKDYAGDVLEFFKIKE